MTFRLHSSVQADTKGKTDSCLCTLTDICCPLIVDQMLVDEVFIGWLVAGRKKTLNLHSGAAPK